MEVQNCTRAPTLDEVHKLIEDLKNTDPVFDKALSDPNSLVFKYLVQFATSIAQQKLRPVDIHEKVVIKENLNSEQCLFLQESYPAYDFEFRSVNNNAHGLLAASRKLETLVLLRKANIRKDTPFIDIGGDILFYESRNYTNYHVDAPILDIKDQQRWSTKIQHLKDGKNDMYRIMEKLQDADNDLTHTDRICIRKAQECYTRAEKAIAVHSLYDISIADLHSTMSKRGIKFLYAVMMYDPAILYSDYGSNKTYGYHWNLSSGGDKIVFSFENDGSYTYSHDMENYLSWFTVNMHHGRKDTLMIEMCENIGGMQYLKICLVPTKEIPSTLSHRIWFNTKGMDCIKVFDYDYSYPNSRSDVKFDLKSYFGSEWVAVQTGLRRWPLRTKNIFLPKEFVKMVKKFVWASTESKFTPLEIFKITRSVASTFIVGKTIVPKYGHLSDEDLWYFVQSIYIYVWEKKYRSGKAIQAIMHDLEQNRKVFEGGFFRKMFSLFYKTRKLPCRLPGISSLHNVIMELVSTVFDVNNLITTAVSSVEFTGQSLLLHRDNEGYTEMRLHSVAMRTKLHIIKIHSGIMRLVGSDEGPIDKAVVENNALARRVNAMNDKEYGFLRAVTPIFPLRPAKHNNSYRKLKLLLKDCFDGNRTISFSPSIYLDMCAAPGGFVKCVNEKYDLDESHFHYYKGGIPMWREYAGCEINVSDGDLTDDDQMVNFRDEVANLVDRVDFITADGCVDVDEGCKEENNYKLIVNEHRIAFDLLKEKGTFIVKVFGLKKRRTLSLIEGFSKYFDITFVYVSPYSPPFSTEFYIVYHSRKEKSMYDMFLHDCGVMGYLFNLFKTPDAFMLRLMRMIRNERFAEINENLKIFLDRTTEDCTSVMTIECAEVLGSEYTEQFVELVTSHYVRYDRNMLYVLLAVMSKNECTLKEAFGKSVRYFKIGIYDDPEYVYERSLLCLNKCLNRYSLNLCNKIHNPAVYASFTEHVLSGNHTLKAVKVNALKWLKMVPEFEYRLVEFFRQEPEAEEWGEVMEYLERGYREVENRYRNIVSVLSEGDVLLDMRGSEMVDGYNIDSCENSAFDLCYDVLMDYHKCFAHFYFKLVATASSSVGGDCETVMKIFDDTRDFNVFDEQAIEAVMNNFSKFVACVRSGEVFDVSNYEMHRKNIIKRQVSNSTSEEGSTSGFGSSGVDVVDSVDTEETEEVDEETSDEDEIKEEVVDASAVFPMSSNGLCRAVPREFVVEETTQQSVVSKEEIIPSNVIVFPQFIYDRSDSESFLSCNEFETVETLSDKTTIPVAGDGACMFAAISDMDGKMFRERLREFYRFIGDDKIRKRLSGRLRGDDTVLELLCVCFPLHFRIVKTNGDVVIGDVTEPECTLFYSDEHIERGALCKTYVSFSAMDDRVKMLNEYYKVDFKLTYFTGEEDEAMVVGNCLVIPVIYLDSRRINSVLSLRNIYGVYFRTGKVYMLFLVKENYCNIIFDAEETRFSIGKFHIDNGKIICTGKCLVKSRPKRKVLNWDYSITLTDVVSEKSKGICVDVSKTTYVDPLPVLRAINSKNRTFPRVVCIMIKLLCDPYNLIKELYSRCDIIYIEVNYPVKDTLLRAPELMDNEDGMRYSIFEQLEIWRTHAQYVRAEFRTFLMSSDAEISDVISPMTTVVRPDISVYLVTINRGTIVKLENKRNALDRKNNYMVAYFQDYRNCEINGFIKMNSGSKDTNDDSGFNQECSMIRVGTKMELIDGIFYLCFSRKTEVWLAEELYKHNKHVLYCPNDFEIEIVEGCPGVGKTHFTISNHNYGKDAILTTTAAAKFDLRKRVAEKYNNGKDDAEIDRRYNSLTGFLLNYSDFPVETLYVDEAFMSHFGSVLMAAKRSNCKKLVIIGDSAQIMYFERNGTVTNYHTFRILPENRYSVRYLTISHRCPLDVVYQLGVMKNSSGEDCYLKKLTSTNKREHTVDTKSIMSLLEVPLNKNAIYLTFTQQDKGLVKSHFSKKLNKVYTVTEFQGQTAANVILVRIEPKNIEPFDQPSQMVVALSRHTESMIYYTTVQDKLSENIMSMRVVPSYLLRGCIEKTIAGGQLPKFEYFEEPAVIGTTLEERKLFRDFVYQNHFSGVTPMQPVMLEVPVMIPSENYCDLEKYHVITEYDNIMQFYADTIVKNATLTWDTNVANKYNALLFEQSPGHLLSNIDFVFKDKFYLPKFRDYLTSSLRTPCPRAVVPSVHSTLKAFVERNGDVPQLHGENDSFAFVENMVDQVFGKTFVSERLVSYASNPIEISVPTLEEWKSCQPGSVLAQLETHYNVHDIPNKDYYEYILKRIAKPTLEDGGHIKFPAPQAIAYQSKQINAYFCTIGKQLKTRLIAAMKENNIFYTDMSIDEFVEVLNIRIPPCVQTNVYNDILEIDMSKYDKSQSHLALMCDIIIFIRLGAPYEFLVLYVLMHAFSKLTSISTGLQAFVSYQRKSGDFFTLGGNSFYSFISVLYSLSEMDYDIESIFGLWSGDDSLLFLKTPLERPEVLLNQLSHVFNLEAKIFKYDCLYFCSKFLVHDGNTWAVFPDPWKMLIKLGRNDLVDREHVEQYRISLIDITAPLKDINHCAVLNRQFSARYKFGYDIDMLIYCFYYFVRDKVAFHSNFYLDDCDELPYCNVRPNLDI